MTSTGRARTFLAKAQEYLASAEDNLALDRPTAASGDSIHAGINAKDAVVTELTGTTTKSRNHLDGVKELERALARRPQAAPAVRALRDLVAAKPAVEYGASLVTLARAAIMVRHAATLVSTAKEIVSGS
ncbi:MAG: hypothetical protein LBL01_07665 [Bifidobacteriaceae bacterium]|jgi:hypothetical protein|nr:hypothetical protein [Bifidobacteriaceae bacterium]